MFRPVKATVKLRKTACKGRESGLPALHLKCTLAWNSNKLLLQIQNKHEFFKKGREIFFCSFLSPPPVTQVMKRSLFLWVCKAYRSQSYVIYIAECSANPVQPQSCLAQGWGSGNWKPDTEGIPNTILKLKTALSAWHVLHESQGLYSFMLSDFLALYCW